MLHRMRSWIEGELLVWKRFIEDEVVVSLYALAGERP